MSIAVVATLVLVSFFVVMPTQMPTAKAYATPGMGVLWNFDDLVANSGGDVIGGGGIYVIINDLTITGGPTPDTVYTRDGESIYVTPGMTVYVDGVFLSRGVAAVITIESASLSPQPSEWGGFRFNVGSIGRFENTEIRHARQGLRITDADVTLRSTWVEMCYPDAIYFEGGLLHVNNSLILGSVPPISGGPNGGSAIYAEGLVADVLWINQSTVVGGNAFPTGPGGAAIFTLNLDGPIGLIGNDIIQGGAGGYNNVDGGGAGGGGLAFHAFPVWDTGGPMPGVNISGNQLIQGGNGGLNNATFDGQSGWGGQGILISDNDYLGTVAIANNVNISGGDGGDNFADANVVFFVGNGGPGISLDNTGGALGFPTRIRGNTIISGGKGGSNSGSSMIVGLSAGMGGTAVNMNDVRNTIVTLNAIVGGHGGDNTLLGVGVTAGQGQTGLMASISQNLRLIRNDIDGGEGGDDFAGMMGPGMMGGPGRGGIGLFSLNTFGIVNNNTVRGGEGGDNYGAMGEGRSGGYGVLVDGLSAPTFSYGTFTGGKGGDNYNDSGVIGGIGTYAFYIGGPRGLSITNSDIYGGAGGNCYAGMNAVPGQGYSAIVVAGPATGVTIADNTMITVGLGGTHSLIPVSSGKGDYGVELILGATMIEILNNYIYNASFAGIYSQIPGVRIDGNTIESDVLGMGIYLDPTANWTNITNNPKIGESFLGINVLQADDVLIRNNLVENTDIGIAILGSDRAFIDRTTVNAVSTWGMRFQTYADGVWVENCTITNSLTWDFSMSLWSNATTLNTTFNGAQVEMIPDTRLTVKNYLDVKVLDMLLSPLPNADVEILDNAAQIYATPFYGGVDPTTDASGDVKWIIVTDRIYFGNNAATENVTDAQVEESGRTFINNPRPVDMSTSHMEVFLELGADIQPPEIHNVLLDGVKFRTVTVGAVVGVAALLNDTLTGNSNISSANRTIGAANWPGSPMFPLVPPYDFPVEDVIDGIATATWMPGSYEIWIYGCDALSNCNTTGDFATLNITTVDNEPPSINWVAVDGLPTVNVVAGALVDITGAVNDNLTGNSVILNANYTIGQDNWPGIPMNPTDGSFDRPYEDVNETIDTAGWPIGPYEIWVYGCDIVPNCNIIGDFATINIVAESQPPEIHSVTVNGLLSVDVPAGTLVTLNATVNDTLTGGSNIMFANYTIGIAAWPGFGMFAVDGTWGDDVSEDVTMTVDTDGWGCGLFDLYVYGWDSVPNYNTTSTAYATINITVCDFQPPEIKQVWIDGSPTQTYFLSVLPATFWLTALIDDTSTGNTPIGGANYTTPAANWPGTPMNAMDGTFDTSWEEVELTIPTPTVSGTYDYCVYGWDQVIPPNYNTTGRCATLDIVDDLGPNVWNVLLSGLPSVSVSAGALVNLEADIDDSLTGWSNIWDANWTEFPPVWPGSPMDPTDGAFDSQTEGVNAVIDTAGWGVGAHTICVNARDMLDNQNMTCQNSATLTITVPPETIPPEILNVRVDGVMNRIVTAGTFVLLTATIDDNNTGGSDIAFANYTMGAQNWPGKSMSGVYDDKTEDVQALIDTATLTPGVYNLYVYGADVAMNNNITSTAFAQITIVVPPMVAGSPTTTGVSVATNITLQFSEIMDTATVESSFSYTDLTSIWTIADGTPTWSGGDTMLVFDPTTNLSFDTTYIVILDGSVAADTLGFLLDGNADGVGGDNFIFAFKTEAQPPPTDTTAPTVLSTDPDDGETNVPVDVPVIKIEFDEPMNQDLIGVDLDGISTEESWDGDTLVITPLEDLEYETSYSVTVTNGEDDAGNSLGAFSFTFTTETEPVVPPPPDEAEEVDLMPWWILIIILAIIIVILSILLLKKKKPEEEMITPVEEELPEEPPIVEDEEVSAPIEELSFEEEEVPSEDDLLEEANS
jgi:hypothetical protein